jgi:threonine aldolase
VNQDRVNEIWPRCERFLAGMTPADRDPRATLLALAERAPAVRDTDRYGRGALAERLEARVAELLGKETAVWLPSGTMAQQIALRIHARERGSTTVAFHPHCHLDVHEARGYEVLHGLHARLLGDRRRLVTAADVEELREPVAAVLLELPQRDLGGLLPPWDELVATVEAARAKGAAVHMDGARLWQCGPYYERPLAEIAALFDTVYVSFYKDLAAPAGSMLLGPAGLVAEARVWQVRHGGRLFTAFPFLLAAERGLDELLPRLPEVVAHARAVGEALAAVDGVAVLPSPPQTAMFHLHVRGDADTLSERALDISERTGTWLGAAFEQTEDPATATIELSFGVASLAVPPAEAAELYSELVSG